MADTHEVAFITGAASGMGRAVAGRLTARGAAVALYDLSEDGLRETAAEVEASGGVALPLTGDVADDDAVAQAVRQTVSQLGPLRTVAACAGIGVGGGMLEPVTRLRLEDWHRTIAVNLTGVYLTARHTIPELLEAGGGAFTAVASDAGVTGAQNMGAYCASKHGVVGLVRCLALDHGPEGVRANAVCPGMTQTPMVERYFLENESEQPETWERTVPLGRFARADEIAAVIAHLTSDEASYTNGLMYVVDGGATSGYFEPVA